MGTFCLNLGGMETTTRYSSRQICTLSTIFRAIWPSFCVIGQNSYPPLLSGGDNASLRAIGSQLPVLYNILISVSRSLIRPDSNFAHAEEVATW